MTTDTADFDWDDWDDEWADWEDQLDLDDPRTYLVPLLDELLAGHWPGDDLPPEEVALRQGVAAPYFQRLLHLAEALEPRVPVKSMFMPPGGDDVVRVMQALGLAGEQDREDLSHLWLDALVSGMITVTDTWARPGFTPTTLAAQPVTEQLRLARSVGVLRLSHVVEAWVAHVAVLHLLIGSLLGGRAWAPVADALEFGLGREYGSSADDDDRNEYAAHLGEGLDVLVDMAVVEHESDRVRLTEFGERVLEKWIQEQFELP